MVEIVEGHFTGPEFVKRFAKQMLKNSIFIGTFHEKRFVESLNAYRDVVSISGDETELIENLIAVKKRIECEFINFPWIGITGPHGIGTPAGYNLWVELPVEVFGKYWFKVKSVDFLSDQIFLKLKVIRPVNDNSSANLPSFTNPSNQLFFSDIKLWTKEKISNFFHVVFTTDNVKSFLMFASVLLSSLVLGFIDIIKYLLEYLLKLIDGLSKLMRTLTPIIIHLINACGRIIFGLFQLIFTLFKRNPSPQPIYNAYINYDPINGMPNIPFDKNFPRALPGIPRPRATIRNEY